MQLDPSLLTSAQIQQPCIQVNNQNILFYLIKFLQIKIQMYYIKFV